MGADRGHEADVDDDASGFARARVPQVARRGSADLRAALDGEAGDADGARLGLADTAHRVAGALAVFGATAPARRLRDAETALRADPADGAEVAAARREVAAVAEELGSAPAPARVLVADDDPDVRALVAYVLERGGFSVLLAGDGPEALQVVRQELPDVAVLDVAMPGLDGVAVCAAVRTDARTAATSVVLLTGSAGPDEERRGREAGASVVLAKPFSPRELLRVVAALRAPLGG